MKKTPSKIGHFVKIEHILITAIAAQRAQLVKFMSSTGVSEGLIIIVIWGHNLPPPWSSGSGIPGQMWLIDQLFIKLWVIRYAIKTCMVKY